MVLKKSNTVLNSGATQRVTKGQAYSGRYYDPFTYQENQISLQFSSGFSASDKRSRSVDFRQTLEALDFLADHLGWEDLIDDLILEKGEKLPRSPTYFDTIVYISLNKKKRWLLPQNLSLAVAAYNILYQYQMPDLYGIDFFKKSKGFPTELWDFMASGVFRRITKSPILHSRFIRGIADDMKSNGLQTSSENSPQFLRELVQFGLMDRFRCVDLNVSLEKDSFGHTLRGQARNKHITTVPPLCENCAHNGQSRKELKDRKKKARTHARGIQRLSTLNTETISKRHKKHGGDISPCGRTKTTFQCNRCSRVISNSDGITLQSDDKQRDYLHIQVTGKPHSDARLLGFNSVIKKYGHLPYNAPRVAICKTKSRPSGRLGVHRGFTYARLKEEISNALVELDESHQNFVKHTMTGDTLLDKGLRGEKSFAKAAIHSTENVKHDMPKPKEYGKITLQDFLVDSKPKERRKKRKPVKKCQGNVILERLSDSENCFLSKDERTAHQTTKNGSVFCTSHQSTDSLIEWSIFDDTDSDNSFIWIDSDCQEHWESDEI